MDIVMNNYDLRGEIFSFFRTEAYKQCLNCNIVCKWNENSYNNPYIEWNNYISCHKCFRQQFLGNLVCTTRKWSENTDSDN